MNKVLNNYYLWQIIFKLFFFVQKVSFKTAFKPFFNKKNSLLKERSFHFFLIFILVIQKKMFLCFHSNIVQSAWLCKYKTSFFYFQRMTKNIFFFFFWLKKEWLKIFWSPLFFHQKTFGINSKDKKYKKKTSLWARSFFCVFLCVFL